MHKFFFCLTIVHAYNPSVVMQELNAYFVIALQTVFLFLEAYTCVALNSFKLLYINLFEQQLVQRHSTLIKKINLLRFPKHFSYNTCSLMCLQVNGFV